MSRTRFMFGAAGLLLVVGVACAPAQSQGNSRESENQTPAAPVATSTPEEVYVQAMCASGNDLESTMLSAKVVALAEAVDVSFEYDGGRINAPIAVTTWTIDNVLWQAELGELPPTVVSRETGGIYKNPMTGQEQLVRGNSCTAFVEEGTITVTFWDMIQGKSGKIEPALVRKMPIADGHLSLDNAQSAPGFDALLRTMTVDDLVAALQPYPTDILGKEEHLQNYNQRMRALAKGLPTPTPYLTTRTG